MHFVYLPPVTVTPASISDTNNLALNHTVQGLSTSSQATSPSACAMELPLQSPAPKKPPHIKFKSDPCVEGLRSPSPSLAAGLWAGLGKYDKEFLLSFRKVFTNAPPDLEKKLLDVGLQTPVTSTPVKRPPGGRVHISVNRVNEKVGRHSNSSTVGI